MKVSVIIPVYNAETMVEKAVLSATIQPETAEVILIDDGSLDNSLRVCQDLADKYNKVKLLRHPGGKNLGAAASRNLGLINTKTEFISFLDADDYYLPKRFYFAKNILSRKPDCDGVYEAVGIEFENDEAKAFWLSSPMGNVGITTMTRILDPDELLRSLLQGKYGRFHINGLIFRRSILKKSGLMNEKLGSMHEDTDFIFRLAIVGNLCPGNLEKPVANRFVHHHNRISAPISKKKSFLNTLKMHMETYRWCKRNGYEKEKALLINRMTIDCNQTSFSGNRRNNGTSLLSRYSNWAFRYPDILMEIQYWKELASCIRMLFHKSTKEENY